MRSAVHQDSAAGSGPARLMSFHGCGDELAALRRAAEASVGPFGLPGVAGSAEGTAYPAGRAAGAPAAAGEGARAAAAPATAAPTAAPAYSGTNDYQAGVDEPDLVKTDGRRIVTVAGGVLQVIDAASRTVTGRLDLDAVGAGIGYQPANLLLSGDHALLLSGGGPVAGSAGGAPPPVFGSRLLLVGLAGHPQVMSSYRIEGSLLDARQIGSAVRVVIGSQPRLNFPAQPYGTTDAQRVAANQAVIRHAGLDAWLPHYEETSGSVTSTGHISCSAVSRPATYSGANLLTVLTFDLASDALGSGGGVAIVADGSTVYGTGSSLYVASDGRWQAGAPKGGAGASMPGSSAAGQPQTEIYRFDMTRPGPPRFAAGGSVPGYLLDQYALSEWRGYLRIATTTGSSWAIADGPPPGAQTSSSAVYVLSTRGPVMRLAGHIAGLGLTERIYAVRFMGPLGYVVTFRQTDPLYTLDLSDPAQPRLRGAVALTGYSAYLHPASDSRLIGIGRQADAMGHVGGTQVSLFDVSDPAAPTRLATFALAAAVSVSDAEFDPHAFLYWPGSHLVVVPVQVPGPVPATPVTPTGAARPAYGLHSGALVLRIDDSGITEAGLVSQPVIGNANGLAWFPPIERSLIISQTLWTISNAGAMASDLTTLRQLAWIHFA
ncbi:MAG TPA: beta-propeller domain-containing protein, partial [Streptosporangiaceae bacterium]|nr:beta-propeller domain-containing protein [Streptosporangiaceae bacterium]